MLLITFSVVSFDLKNDTRCICLNYVWLFYIVLFSPALNSIVTHTGFIYARNESLYHW